MGVAADADGFDAFISYSHAADGQLTPAVRLGMQAVGKKWYRLRASRIFCDQSNLSATPELWPTIERALSASRFLVLLASPQAAASVWVQKELDWWRSNRPPSTLLIGLTDGELAWDEARQRFDPVRTTALPPTVLNWFEREPLWVDLTVTSPNGGAHRPRSPLPALTRDVRRYLSWPLRHQIGINPCSPSAETAPLTRGCGGTMPVRLCAGPPRRNVGNLPGSPTVHRGSDNEAASECSTALADRRRNHDGNRRQPAHPDPR